MDIRLWMVRLPAGTGLLICSHVIGLIAYHRSIAFSRRYLPPKPDRFCRGCLFKGDQTDKQASILLQRQYMSSTTVSP